MRTPDLDRLRVILGETTFTQEVNKGREFTLNEAITALRDELGAVASGNVSG